MQSILDKQHGSPPPPSLVPSLQLCLEPRNITQNMPLQIQAEVPGNMYGKSQSVPASPSAKTKKGVPSKF